MIKDISSDYFKRVFNLTGTKFWINNVTREEAIKAIDAGALGCTQNPSYTWKMLNHPYEAKYTFKLLNEAIKKSDDPNEVECILQGKLVKGISDIFLPLYEKSHGKYGYVSIQGDPVNEEDPEVILKEARINRSLNPNIMIKIPATSAGLAAMEILISENTHINATEVMGLSQAMSICKMYRKVSEATGKTPVIYYSLITGIFDEYLSKYVISDQIDISTDILYMAGLIVAKKVYQITKSIYPEVGVIGGGVRGLHHFTEMVGADVCITMNWDGQAEELLKQNLPVIPRFFNPLPDLYLNELLTKVPDFQRAYNEEGLTIEEYEHFGPVNYFRDIFVGAWNLAIDHIKNIK
jgi:transaldolase